MLLPEDDQKKALEVAESIQPLLNGLTYDQIKFIFMTIDRRITSRIELPTADMKKRSEFWY